MFGANSDEAVRWAKSCGVSASDLPGGNSSPASMYHAIADYMRRHGLIDVNARNALIAIRERRIPEINAAFAQCGIY